MFDQTTGHCGPVTLTCKLNHHRKQICKAGQCGHVWGERVVYAWGEGTKPAREERVAGVPFEARFRKCVPFEARLKKRRNRRG